MSSGLEAKEEKKVVMWAVEQGILVLKLNLMGNRGWPDRLFVGKWPDTLFIEFKQPGEEPTPLQAFRHKQLLLRGWNVAVIDNAYEGINLLDAALLSVRRYEVDGGPRSRGIIFGPGTGKDINLLRRFFGAEGAAIRAQNASDSSAESLLQRMAERAKEVEQLRRLNDAHLARERDGGDTQG